MSDPNEKKDNKKNPDGMVRKTRRVRKKRKGGRSTREQHDAKKLFAKAKELLIGMQDEDEDYGPVDIAEQVRRLQRKKEDDRVLDDVWGTKKKSTTWLWFVLIGVITAVVALVIGLTIWVNNESIDDGIVTGNPFRPVEDDVDRVWYYDDIEKVVQIIERINSAKEVEEIEDVVRDSPFRAVSPIDLEDWGSKHLTNSLSGFVWNPKTVYSSEDTGSKERVFLQVSGALDEGGKYIAYFVKEEDRVVLDWDATTGFSELTIEEVLKAAPRKQTLLRCKVTKRNPSYDQQFGETDYSGYVLSGDAIDDFFFAYVDLNSERGRAIDRDLRLLLNYQSFVTDEPPLVDENAMLRVQFDPQIGSEGEFEIVEYLNDGWVTP